MKTLVAGPWLGEFGWELMMWHAHIRFLAKNNRWKEVVCLVRTGHEYLYSDFSNRIFFVDLKGEKNGWKINESRPKIPRSTRDSLLSEFGEVDFIVPGILFDFKDQDFIMFHEDGEKYDVIFHCRGINKANNRNWPIENWNLLRNHFWGLKIACVGSLDESFCINNTDDKRGVSLKELTGLLSNAKMIIGPSSGPMHFASLCGCTHIVFTDNSFCFGDKQEYNNRYRYEKAWNPLGSKSIVVDKEGWRPSVKTIINTIENEIH